MSILLDALHTAALTCISSTRPVVDVSGLNQYLPSNCIERTRLGHNGLIQRPSPTFRDASDSFLTDATSIDFGIISIQLSTRRPKWPSGGGRKSHFTAHSDTNFSVGKKWKSTDGTDSIKRITNESVATAIQLTDGGESPSEIPPKKKSQCADGKIFRRNGQIESISRKFD